MSLFLYEYRLADKMQDFDAGDVTGGADMMRVPRF